MLNLATILEYSAREYKDKTAVIFGGTRLTYAELSGAVDKIANGLVRLGIRKGDKVALTCPNLPYFPMVYFGILKAGGTVVPMNVLLKRNEIAYHLKDSDARAYFCFEGTPELPMGREGWAAFQAVDGCEHFHVITADPAAVSPIQGAPTLGKMMAGEPGEFDLVPTRPDDTAVILYTSGTTGLPKGAELTHSNMVMNAMVSKDLLALCRDDVLMVVLPLFHSFGQTVLMNAGLSKGNSLVMMPRFTPDSVLKAMQREKVTVFAGVPTMYWALLNFEDKEGAIDLEQVGRTLRIGVSGAASLPLEIIRGMEQRYKLPIIEGYGLSETSPAVCFTQSNRQRKPGSVGTPVWGIEVRIAGDEGDPLPAGEVGEVMVRGHNVMKGYYRKPEETRAAFNDGSWFHTGDLGKLDEDGYLYIVDRVKDMHIRGGFNIDPREIEERLMAHPDISLAAVVGVPHRQYGEEVKAFVVLKNGKSATEADIVAWSKEQMASYKYPRMVEIRDSLPMTATGKILKREFK